jgi:hypothetical protein
MTAVELEQVIQEPPSEALAQGGLGTPSRA